MKIVKKNNILGEDVSIIQSKDKIEDNFHERLRLEWKDRIALILVVWRIILPWGLTVTAIYFLLFLLFDALV